MLLATLYSLLTIFLTGCIEYDYNQPPAPVVQYGDGSGAESAGMHTVDRNETLWSVAQSYRLSIPDIIRINHLQAPYALRDGQRIKLPAPRVYTARKNDTLYGISRLFDVSTTELVRLNNLSPPYAVPPGMVLRLPPPPAPQPPPPWPRPYTVFSLAQASQPTEREETPYISRVAGLPGPVVGNDDMERAPVPQPVRVGTVQTETLAPPPTLDTAVPVVGASPQAKASLLPPDVPARSGARFAWPVRGKIISGYGTKAGGLHNDGINIRVARSTPVKAAENGVVVYAGNQLKGFGNLILIRHADRWMTAYAHLDSIAVQKGGTVKRGDAIGKAGSTGGVDGPQLHFEIRRGTEALNPEAFLEDTVSAR